MKKILSVFTRDLKIAMKESMALWIVLVPIIFAVIILVVSPGITDTTLNLAVHDSVDDSLCSLLEDYANISYYDSLEDMEERVLRRDEVVGLADLGNGPEIFLQGNESEMSVEMAKLFLSLDELGTLDNASEDGRISFLSFREETPPLKLTLSVVLMLLITIICAMLIALGLVDEKADRTIRAASVTPMSQTAYVLSKSIIGVLALIINSVVCLLILGMTHINWVQMLLMILSSGLLSIIVAFAIGLASSDFIEAAGSIKVLMLPLLAGVLVYEFAAEKWHWAVMWSPFYWAHRGMTEIITKRSTWPGIGLYTAVILLVCALAFLVCRKSMRKNLS